MDARQLLLVLQAKKSPRAALIGDKEENVNTG